MAGVEGEYLKGGPGVSTMPIPLLGRGSVSVGAGGLTVVGSRKRLSPLFVVAVVVLLCASAFAIGMLAGPDTLGQRTSTGKGKLMVGTIIGLGLGALAAAVVLGRGKLQAWTFEVPWRAVRSVAIAGDRELIVTIKGTSPKGTLHFAPDGGPGELRGLIESSKPR